jgi:hypothetical protein
MSELRSALPKLLMESVLIVFSVLLALGVDEWRETRQTRQRVDQALESFLREVERNRQAVQGIGPYHERLRQHFLQLSRTRVRTVRELHMEGFQGLGTLTLEDAAWRTATATGALAQMDYKTASLLSRIYTLQEETVSRHKSIFNLLQPAGLTEQALPITVDLLSGTLGDVVLGEKNLLKRYEAVERHLKGLGIAAAPSAAGAP